MRAIRDGLEHLPRHKRYYERHKKEINAKEREKYTLDKEKYKDKQRRLDATLKGNFIVMYGGKCECCGETEHAFLTIDHICGQEGIKKKETGRQAYRKALKEFRPDLYRVLCHNCNAAVRWGRVCPHQKGGRP